MNSKPQPPEPATGFLTRAASMVPETVNEEARTVEVVWSSGAAVPRRDRMTGEAYNEVLSLDPAHVDLSRLNGGAPLLDTHGAWSLNGIIGVVEKAWIVEGDSPEGRALVRFSERDEVEPVWRAVDIASQRSLLPMLHFSQRI